MAVDDTMAMTECSGTANLSFDVKNRAGTIPSRCGSAPPSYEEAFAAMRNSMLIQQSSVNNANRDKADNAAEEILLSNPEYIAYYNAHVNLNPRLPPPLGSRENRNLVSRARKLTSFDVNGDLNNKMRLLSTHQEVPENDTLTQRQMLEDQTQIKDETASQAGRNGSFDELLQGLNDHTRAPGNGDPPSTSFPPGKSDDAQHNIKMAAQDSNISDASVSDHVRRQHQDMLLFEAYGLPLPPPRFQAQLVPQGMPMFSGMKPVMHNPGLVPALPYMAMGNQFRPRLQTLSNVGPQFGLGGYALPSSFYPPYLGAYPPPNMVSQAFDPFAGCNLFNRATSLQPPFPRPIQGQYFHHSAPSRQYDHLLAQQEPNSAAFVYHDHSNLYDEPRGHRGSSNAEDPKRHSYLEELKFGGSAKLELSDITGKIVEFSTDQHGSRFIQQKLEFCTVQEKESVFAELLPHASHLMIDVYGNYVIQKLFEHGTGDHRKQLANQFIGQMLTLSLHMYGCRVIQKALEVIELDQKAILVRELDGHVIKCVHDQNGNHVIQKCIEHIPAEEIGFLISALNGEIATLSVHPYGCRVIQRVLEHCQDTSATHFVIDEILESAGVLADDQYGNYVIQHVLQLGKPHERSKVISKLAGKFAEMSQHKYASNVIEKCIMYGNASEQESVIREVVGRAQEDGNLVIMMKDQYANYVIQRILDICNDEVKIILMNCIGENIQSLKKYTYGKHIVTRYEQLLSSASGNQEQRAG